MVLVYRTSVFSNWIENLRDQRAVARIAIRIDRLTSGNAGDAKSVGNGVSELKIDYGPGYRVYFTRDGDKIIVLLCGGDKDNQSKDIARARRLAEEWRKSQ
jgi:putative addiction module killer protein